MKRIKKINKIISAMSDIICLIDLKLKISYISPSVKKFLGYNPKNLIGSKIYDFIHYDDLVNVKPIESLIIRKRLINSRTDFRIKDIDGGYTWVEAVANFIYDNNEIIGIIINIRDITKRKYLEEKLKRSNDKLEEISRELKISNKALIVSQKLFRLNFEKTNIGMMIVDLHGNLTVNDSMANMLGYSKEELKTIDFFEITHPEDLEESREKFSKLFSGEIESFGIEKRYIRKDGKIVWAYLNAVLVSGEDDREMYFLAHSNDISDIKRQEEIIRSQKEELVYSKMKTQFFANLSHELKTPLNLIFSALQILRRSLSKHCINSEVKYLDIIKQNSMRLLKLTNNVIDLTKIDTDNYEINYELYNIVSIVEHIVESTKSYILEQNKKIYLHSDINEKIIKCDTLCIERIFLNLISNAIKFTDDGDEIFINIFDKGDTVLISVRDTGIGIKKDKINIIFDLFRQADESFTRRAEGSGIGLSIVKSLVELHGGTIYPKSVYGKGTEFLVSLPVDNNNQKENKMKYMADNLMNKMDVEFSDIYNI